MVVIVTATLPGHSLVIGDNFARVVSSLSSTYLCSLGIVRVLSCKLYCKTFVVILKSNSYSSSSGWDLNSECVCMYGCVHASVYICVYIHACVHTVNQKIFGVQKFSDGLLISKNEKHENFLTTNGDVVPICCIVGFLFIHQDLSNGWIPYAIIYTCVWWPQIHHSLHSSAITSAMC